MANVFIITEEGWFNCENSAEFVTDTIRTKFNDTSELFIYEGPRFNVTWFLPEMLKDDPEHTYVFVVGSKDKAISVIHDIKSIDRCIDLLEKCFDDNATSWSVLMQFLGRL